jgi:hypothetical protein
MTSNKAAPAFMDLPLEVRHSIFEHVAVRDFKPKKLFRYWFEKKEVKELVAQDAIDNPNGPIPRVVYANDDGYHEYDDESTVNDDDSEEDGQEEDEDTDEDSENEDGDENDDDDDDDDDEDEEAEQDEDSDENEDGSEIDGEDEGEQLDEAVPGAHDTQSATAGVLVPAHAAAQDDLDTTMEDAGEVHVDEDESDDEGEAEGNDREEGDDDSEGDEDVADDDDDTDATVAATQPPAPAPMFRPHHKWRHIPNFMRLTHCPPPLQLLLTSHQLNNEAKNWFYDVAVLRIDATGSFAHTSFFEEAFSQITDAAFSPMGK